MNAGTFISVVPSANKIESSPLEKFKINLILCALWLLYIATLAASHCSSRSTGQSFLLQLKRSLKCINHTIPTLLDIKLSIVSQQFKVYNGLNLILRELGRIACSTIACDILLYFRLHHKFCTFFKDQAPVY